MRALLVTSRVTFVPDNYNAVVCGLAHSPHVAALIELDNRALSLYGKALGLIALGAPRTGGNLLMNIGGRTARARREAYAKTGKPVHRLTSMNTDEALRIVRDGRFDLIINARTRCIYKSAILNEPALGCLNVHHGLLPRQRGTMCDLWALHEGQPSGFSIHRMSAKIDAGEILEQREVHAEDRAPRDDYPAYLARSAEIECEVIGNFLERVAIHGLPAGTPNIAPPGLKHRRNPTRREISEMKKKGLRL